MLANPCKCLTITINALPSIRMSCDCLRKCCENNKNMLSWRILGAYVPNIRNRPGTTANAYEHLRMSGDHFVIIANLWRIAFVSPFAIYSPLCESSINMEMEQHRRTGLFFDTQSLFFMITLTQHRMNVVMFGQFPFTLCLKTVSTNYSPGLFTHRMDYN